MQDVSESNSIPNSNLLIMSFSQDEAATFLQNICQLKINTIDLGKDVAVYEGALREYFLNRPADFALNLQPLLDIEETTGAVKSLERLTKQVKQPDENITKLKEGLSNILTEKIDELTKIYDVSQSIKSSNIQTEIAVLTDSLEINIANLKKQLECVNNVTKELHDAHQATSSLTKGENIKNLLVGNDNKILNTMIFLINTLMNIPVRKMDEHAMDWFSIIFRDFGRFFYNNANNYENPIEASKLSLLCFTLAGTNDDEEDEYYQLKKASYKSVLRINGLLNDFSLESYCIQEPNNFIKCINELLEDEFFNDAIEMAFRYSNNNAELEFIKLNYLLSKAHSKNKDELKEKYYYQLVKKYLLLSQPANAYEKLVDFSKQFNDMDILLKMAKTEFYIGKPESAEYFLAKTIALLDNKEITRSEFSVLNVAIVCYFISKSPNNRKLGKELFLKLLANNPSATKFIINEVHKLLTKNKYLLCAKIFMEAAYVISKSSKEYLTTALDLLKIALSENQNHPAIHFYLYKIEYELFNKINFKSLLAAIRGGNQAALREVRQLAETSEYEKEPSKILSSLFIFVGDLYINGKALEQNYELAAYYYIKSGTSASLFKLAEMFLNNQISVTVINPNELLKKIATVMDESMTPHFIPLLETYKKNPEYKKEAILALIHFHIIDLKICKRKMLDSKINAKKIASLVESFFDNFPDELIRITHIFKLKEVIDEISPSYLGEIFEEIYYIDDLKKALTDEFKLSFLEASVRENGSDLMLITISCPELRTSLSLGRIINILNKYFSGMNIKDVAELVVSIIIERNANEELLDWLFANTKLLQYVLKNVDLLCQLNENQGWIDYLKNPEKIKQIQDPNSILPQVRTPPNNSIFSNFSKLPTFFKDLFVSNENTQMEISTQLVVEAKTIFINKKMLIVDLLYKCDQELAEKGNKKLFTFIQEVKGLINTINSLNDLDNLVETLCQKDKYFDDQFNQFKQSSFSTSSVNLNL